MRSNVKCKLTGKTKDGWYPWFAWHPVKIHIPIENPNDPQDRAWIKVWLEYVEWKRWDAREHPEIPPSSYYIYRLRQDQTEGA